VWRRVAIGVQVVNLVTSRVVRIIGKVENTERFLRIALYQVFVRPPSSSAAAVPTCSYSLPLSVC